MELEREPKQVLLDPEPKAERDQQIEGFCNGLMLDQNQYMTFSSAMRQVFPAVLACFNPHDKQLLEDTIAENIHSLIEGECGDISAEFISICEQDNLVRVSQVYNFCCNLVRWAYTLYTQK